MEFSINGIHHIELSVSNFENSKVFYGRLPGFKLVANYPNFAMFDADSFYIGLTDHKGELKEKAFSPYRAGLDHVSFRVKEKEDLEKALRFFESNNIKHGEIKKLPNNVYTLAFKDPDGIALELAWRESA